jgi:hypothetical protein
MRWPFGRRGRDGGASASATLTEATPAAGTPAAGPSASAGSVSAGSTGSVPVFGAQRPSRRDWAGLPPLRTATVSAAPLISGPAPVQPPLPGPRQVVSVPIAPATGRVEGLATARPERTDLVPAPTTSAATTVVAEQPQSAGASMPVELVHRAAVATVEATLPLTMAVDDFVGPAREPAEPYRPPSWMRQSPPAWMLQTEDADPLGLGLPITPEPARRPAPTPPRFPTELLGSPPPFIPPAAPPLTPPAAPAERPVQPGAGRRPNLGQSRRLGLGTPISRPGTPDRYPDAATLAELAERSAAGIAPPTRAPEGPQLSHPQPAEPQVAELPQAVDLPPGLTGLPPGATVTVELEPEPASEPPPAASAPPEGGTAAPSGDTRPPADRAAGRVLAADATRPTGRVQPLYRPAPEAARVAPARPAPARTRELVHPVRVPPELASAMSSSYRVDVSAVPVRRGPAVSAEARGHGARAFTRAGTVFLPAEAGPVESPATRGLLAHELVHAVQQRTLGGALPSPSSAHGQALEAEAVAAERFHAGMAGAPEPPPLIHAPHLAHAGDATEAVPHGGGHTQLAVGFPTAPASQFASEQHDPLDRRTQERIGEIAERHAQQVVQQSWTNPAQGGSGFSGGGGGMGGMGGGRGSAPAEFGTFMNADGGIEAIIEDPRGGRQALDDRARQSQAAQDQFQAAQRAMAGQGQGGGVGGRGGGAGTAGAGGGGGGGGTFNREGRRQELVNDRLALINNGLQSSGQQPIMQLSADQEADIDRQLDEEQRTGVVGAHGGGGGGRQGPAEFGTFMSGDGSIEAIVEDEHGGRTALDDRAHQSQQQQADWQASQAGGAGGPGGAGGAGGAGAAAGAGGPAALRSGGAAAAGGSPGGAAAVGAGVTADDLDMETVTAAIYDKVRSRLRQELLIDRERAGMLSDFR